MLKTLRNIAIVAVLIGLFFYFWGQYTIRGAATPPPVIGTPVPIFIPTPTPVPGWRSPNESRQITTAPQPVNLRPNTAATPTAADQGGIDWMGIARRTGCSLEGVTQRGRDFHVTVTGPSHTHVGNFLDEVTKTGKVRDFELGGKLTPVTVAGRNLFRTTYVFHGY